MRIPSVRVPKTSIGPAELATSNFRERYFPRVWVNKGKKKGRSYGARPSKRCHSGVEFASYDLLTLAHN